MGYECPVCATPQADRRHLADHLAVTAMTHDGDHADWLDEHVPDWSEHSPQELGATVADHAPTAEYDRVFEDTVGSRGDDHGRGHGHSHGTDASPATVVADAARDDGRGELTDADRSVIEEARTLTRRMLDDEGDEDVERRGRTATAADDGTDGSEDE
ncbi:hypothetical protein BRD10_01415 [Halobacteriales archaeon SW_12_71_31]|nr:MAG: hypothetical protein BRD10_01415 [Halobacteriales archaeon SW_12_71_31]